MKRFLSPVLLAVGLAIPLPAVLVGYSIVHGSTAHVATNPAPLTPCAGAVITVHGDDPVPCDLQHGQRLDVTGITVDQCDHMGGEPIALVIDGPTTCEGADW